MWSAPVKGKTEAGRRREARALETRRRVVEAGLALFLERGYVATTVEAIAREAGVAPATVYQAFGSKAAVLAGALDVAIAGDAEPVALLDRRWVSVARQEPDPLRRLVRVIHHATEIAARTSPIKEIVRDAAAVEPALRDLIDRDHQRRRQTQQALVEVIVGESSRFDPAALRGAADTFSALVTSDAYALVVGRMGWTMTDWRRWLVRILEHEILGAEVAGTAALPRSGRPTRDHSARSVRQQPAAP